MPGWDGWAVQVLDAMGLPRTPTNLQFLAHDWFMAESGLTGSGGRFNPLNTTRVAPGLEGATDYNQDGVKNYLNPQMGLRATVGALSQSYYKDIVDAMRSGKATRTQLAQLVAASPWGTKHFPTLGVNAQANAPVAGIGVGSGDPHNDLVNQLESVYSGLSAQKVVQLPDIVQGATPQTQAISGVVSGEYPDFSNLLSSQPSRTIAPVYPKVSGTLNPSQIMNPMSVDLGLGSAPQAGAGALGNSPIQTVDLKGFKYVNPIPQGSVQNRTDQGVDFQMKVGAAIPAIGDAQVISVTHDPGGYGQMVVYKILHGPLAGRMIFIGHTTPVVKAGQTIRAGQAVTVARNPGDSGAPNGWAEIGFAAGPGMTAARARGELGGGHADTRSGQEFLKLLRQLGLGANASGRKR